VKIYNETKNIGIRALTIFLIVIAVICVVALFTSGAFMSIRNVIYDIKKTIHNIAAVEAIIAMGEHDEI